MTVWVIVRSTWADWADHPEWMDEDGAQTIERGYWTSEEAAQAWADLQISELVEHARSEWAASQAGERASHEARSRSRVRAQAEWDAIKAGGLTPRTARPENPRPFVETEWDEDLVRLQLKAQERWIIESVEEHA